MTTSSYEKLVERCYFEALASTSREDIRIILAEVLRTLEAVTPEMVQAAFGNFVPDALGEHAAKDDFLAMLRASPLIPLL